MTTLYNPSIVINNRQIFVKPNTVTTIDGLGEVSVEALSAGAGVVDTAHSEDVSTQVSHIKFTLDNTTENQELKRSWHALVGANIITIQDKDFRGVYVKMSLINDPESSFKNLPEIPVEFKGNPAL